MPSGETLAHLAGAEIWLCSLIVDSDIDNELTPETARLKRLSEAMWEAFLSSEEFCLSVEDENYLIEKLSDNLGHDSIKSLPWLHDKSHVSFMVAARQLLQDLTVTGLI